MKYEKSIFLFHRDLRLNDNTGFLHACEQSKEVIPCFIFDTDQLNNNKYRGDACVQFMIESLEDLWNQIKEQDGTLYLFHGKTLEVLEKILNETGADAFFSNADYTPFSRKRDGEIQELCMKKKIAFKRSHDALLTVPGEVLKNDGDPYTVFTPFMRKAREQSVLKPTQCKGNSFYTHRIESAEHKTIIDTVLPKRSSTLAIKGGRAKALEILQSLSKQEHYKEERDVPSLDSTTHLAPHHKFGTCSVRETYHAVVDNLSSSHGLITELYWRDFFTHISYHFPHIFSGAFRPKYNNINWNTSKSTFEKWCNGQTGFPIVDAGMRELNETGYMHNRVRMIVASFLVKDLHINWQKGERYFAQKLTDYDPSVNNGNWQWAASTGCDAQPYFRIFNPWRQQERYDKDCIYIKKWIPELQNIEPKLIHKWYKEAQEGIDGYSTPIVDHATQAAQAKDMFKNVS